MANFVDPHQGLHCLLRPVRLKISENNTNAHLSELLSQQRESASPSASKKSLTNQEKCNWMSQSAKLLQ